MAKNIPNVFQKYLEDSPSSQTNIFSKYIEADPPVVEVQPEQDKGLHNRITNFFGESAKKIKSVAGEAVGGFTAGWPAGILQAASAIESTLGVSLDKLSKPKGGRFGRGEIKIFETIGNKLKKKAIEDMDAADIYSQVNLPVENPQSFKENIKNPRWIGQGIGTNLPNMLASLGVSITVGAITKNPVAALSAGFGSSFSLEGGFAYNDAIKHGVADDKAEKIGATVGVINGMLDALPIGRLLSRLPGGTQIKRKVLSEVTKSVIKQTALESSTESLQEIVSNALAKTYDKDRSLWAGTLESAFFGGIMGGGVDVIESIGSLAVKSKTPEQQQQESKQLQESTGLQVVETPPEVINLTPEKPGMAEVAAQRIERKLSGEERLRQSAKGMELLKAKLTKEEVATKGTEAEKKLLEGLDAILTGKLEKPGKKTKVKEATPEEKTEFETKLKEAGYDEEAIAQINKIAEGPDLENIDEEAQAEATQDWEDNHAEEFAKLDEQFNKLQNEAKTAKKEAKKELTQKASVIDEKMTKIENDFLEKWQGGEKVENPFGEDKTFEKTLAEKEGEAKTEERKITITKKGKEKLANAIEGIKRDVAEDSDRHPAAIIAGRGFTFTDDIEVLREYAKSVNDKEFLEIMDRAEFPSEKKEVEEAEEPKPKFELTNQFKKEKGLKPQKEKVQKIAKTKEVKTKVADILKPFTGKSLPIIQGIAVDGNKVKATDLEIAISYELDKSVGKIVLPVDQLKGKNLEDIVIDEKKGTATIGGLEIKGEKLSEFPELPEVKVAPQLAVSYASLESGLSKTFEHISTGESRPEISGLLIKNENGRLRLTATDSFRLNQVYVDAKIDGDFEAIIPRKSVQKISRLLKQIKPSKPIEVAIDKKNNTIQFKSGKVTVVSRTIDGNYPDYKKIIPSKAKITTTINKDSLSAVLKEAPSTGPNNDVKIHYATDGKSITVKVINPSEGISFSKSVPATTVKKEVKINPDEDIYLVMPINQSADELKARTLHANKGYINDFLDTADTPTIELLNTGENLPIAMREPGAKYQTAFSDESKISPLEAKSIVAKYFTPEEVGVNFADQILTPQGLKALGRYSNGMITFLKNPAASTPEHEVLHAYFDLFTAPEEKAEILDLTKAQYGLITDLAAEEKLADDFVDYVRGKRQGFVAQTLDYFKRMWKALKALFGNKGSKVEKLYEDIIAGERKAQNKPSREEKFGEGRDVVADYADEVVRLGANIMDRLATKNEGGIGELIEQFSKLTDQDLMATKGKQSLKNAIENTLNSPAYEEAFNKLKNQPEFKVDPLNPPKFTKGEKGLFTGSRYQTSTLAQEKAEPIIAKTYKEALRYIEKGYGVERKGNDFVGVYWELTPPKKDSKFQLDLSEFSPEEQQVINLLQDSQDVPDSLSEAVKSLQDKGIIKPTAKPTPVRSETPIIKLEQGERVSRRGITISRSRQAISRPYRVSYETGDKYVVRTFETPEDASRRFNSMVELRSQGFARSGELPAELQATDKQKARAHAIAHKKKITNNQYKRLEKIYTGVDSMTKMTPEKADEFIKILETIQPKFGGKISISRSQEIVSAEEAERKFHNTTIGWLLDIFRTPANVFRKIGVYDQAKPLFDAFSARRDYIESTFEKLAGWQKKLGITKISSLLTQKNIIAEQSRRMFRAINNPEANVKLSEEEALIVDHARELADEVADLVDEARAEIGLQPMNRRENYITNLLTDEAHFLIQQTKQAPNELYALLDIKMPSNVFDKLLIQRKGGLPIKEDFWKSLKTMVQVHSKYIYLNPPVHRFERFMRFYGDKIPALSRKYIQGRLNRFLGRPGLTERFLKGVDESITNGLMKIPGLSKEVRIEFENGLSEVINVPRITSRLAQRGLSTLKAIRYTYDLAWSLSFYTLNLTQFWINTVPKLRGNLFEVYGSAVGGYAQMMADFFRPSKWEYWRQRGVLTEIDNVIDLEFGTKGGADVLNIFAKLSEFNNRVAATIATEKNMAMLAKHGKFGTLYKELNSAYGKEAQEYAKNLSDITQFRYGIAEKPVAFDNPIMDLYYQYNTFALKQAELIEGMLRNVDIKNTWKDFVKAKESGKTKEFIADLSQGERAEFMRYIINVFILSMILGMSYVWKSAVKGIVPNQMEGALDILQGLWRGDSDQMGRGWKKFLTPPAYDLVEKAAEYGIVATIKNAKVFRQLNLLSAALQGEGTIENISGKTTEKIDREVAVKRLFAPTEEKTAKANSEGWDMYFELQESYTDTRKEAISLIKDGKTGEAKKLAIEYNKWAKPKLMELIKIGVTDVRLKENIKKGKKGFVVSKSDFSRWVSDAKKP